VRVEYITAGPAEVLADEALLPHIRAFALGLADAWHRDQPTSCTRSAGPAAWPRWPVPGTGSFPSCRRSTRCAPPSAAITSGRTARPGLAGWPRDRDGGRSRLERAVACSADAVIATSTDEVSDLTGLGVPRTAVSVVPFGVDPVRFSAEAPSRRALSGRG